MKIWWIFYWSIWGWAFSIPIVTVFGQDLGTDRFFSLEIANPNPVGSGARALGQGNAFIAVADDATAASWNPGGLPQLEKPEFSFALEAVAREMRRGSNSHPEAEGKDSFNFEDFNYASLVFPFHLGVNMVVSLNYLKLFRFDKEMNFSIDEEEMDSRREIITNSDYDFDQDGSFSVLAPAFGINVTERLSLGITLNIWNHDITGSSRFKKKEFTRLEGKAIFSNGPSLTFKGYFREINKIEVDEGYSVVIGGLYRLNKYWAFGAVVKPAFDLELDHEFTSKDILNGIRSEPTNDPRNAELDMPMILGAGVAWRPNDSLTISTDITWTDWSKYQFIQDGGRENPVTGRATSMDKLKDTYTLRLGSEYLFVSGNYILPLRWGIGYDPAPAVDSADDFYTLNVGTGIQLFKRVNVDIAYEFRWGNNVNSDTLQIIRANQNVYRHRFLSSLIVYF